MTDTASDVLEHLRALDARGPKGLVAQLVDSLLSESSEKLAFLREAAERGDFEGVFRTAHSLQERRDGGRSVDRSALCGAGAAGTHGHRQPVRSGAAPR